MQKLGILSTPAQRFTVLVEGVSFSVRLAWNQRKAAWYLDIHPTGNEAGGVKGVRLEEGGMVGTGGLGVRVGFGGFIWCKQLSRQGGEVWFVSEAEAAGLRSAVESTAPTLRFTGI